MKKPINMPLGNINGITQEGCAMCAPHRHMSQGSTWKVVLCAKLGHMSWTYIAIFIVFEEF